MKAFASTLQLSWKLAYIPFFTALFVQNIAAQQFQQCASYIVLQQALANYPQPECKCQDVKKLEDFLKNVQKEMGIIKEVQQQGGNQSANKAIATALNEELSIGQIRWDKNNQVCTPIVCEAWIQNNCKSIWRSTFVHEQEHCDYEHQTYPKLDWLTTPIGSLVTFWTLRLNADWYNAQEEAAARQKQMDYLNQQIQEIKKNCPYTCKENGVKFKTLPECLAQCSGKRTLGHLDICTQE